MAPIVVDPHLLTGVGGAVGGVGDELAAAVGTLGSALAGCGAMAGHDTAGLAFGKSYEQAAQNLLNAVDAAVNACRKTGFGVSMSATNYSRAEAASTVGGGEALPVPGDPQAFEAPRVPSPFGSGVAAPLAWALVESFVGSVWPDGDPTQLRVAAGAWRAFGLTIRGVAGQLNGPLGVISGQQIPEGPAMTSALSQIGAGTSQAAEECAKLATQLDEFAADVQSAQDAIRDLLHRLSTPGGLFHEVVAVFKGDAFEEIKKIAEDIKAVLHNLKRQATAREQLVQQAMATLDGAVLGFEAHMRKEFIHYLGEDVGSRVSVVFDLNVDIIEGAGKGAAGFGDMITQLNPGRFAYDPQGAGATWKGLVDTGLRTNPLLAPLHPQETLQANKELLKGLVHADDWGGDRPGLGAGETLFDIATLATPGAGAAGAGAKGAELAGGAARGFKAGGEAADAAGAAGRAGARAGEAAGAARGFTSVTEESGKLATSLNKVGDDVVAGAQSGRLPSATPAPALDHAPTPAGPAAEARVAPHAPAPVGDHPTVGSVHEPAPAASAPHPGGAPGEQLPGSGAGHTPQSAAPHTPAPVDGHPSDATLTAARTPEPAPIHPAHEPVHGGYPEAAHPYDPPTPHDPGSAGGGDHGGGDGGPRESFEPSDGSVHGDDGLQGDDRLSSELTGEKRDEILAMEKGSRPDPEEYLSPEYIEQHLEKFDDGATRFMPENNLQKYGISQADGTSFVMARGEVDAMFEATAGDPRAMERALGWPEGYLDKHTVIRIDIPHPEGHNMRIPSGNEAGANDLWLPGGLLPGGLSETVIDGGTLSANDYIITRLAE